MRRYPASLWQRPTSCGKGRLRYSVLSGLTTVARTTMLYDAAGNVTSIQHTNGSGNNVGNYTYAYDPGHNLTSETDNGTLHTYAYNSASELTGQGTTTYGYDSSGNRTGSGQVIGTGNQLLSDSTWTYSYDGEGNLTKKTMGLSSTTWTYGYDNANHLVQAQEWSKDPSNGGTLLLEEDFKYDVYGNLVEEDVTQNSTTTTTRYAVDGWNPAKAGALGVSGFDVWAELNGSNQVQTHYLTGDVLDQVFARVDNTGNAFWLLDDHLGSVVAVLDHTGTLKDQIAYDAWGNITSESASSYGGVYKWDGYRFDSNLNMYQAGARWYDPTTGRWISQDPLGFDAGDSNLYRYVHNSPTEFSDPSGLWQIARHNDEWATAIPNHGDTIAGLAEKIGLDAKDFRKWLTFPLVRIGTTLIDGSTIPNSRLTPTDKLFGGQPVFIPNTVYCLWIGNVRAFGRFVIHWNKNLTYLRDLGFNVQEMNYDTMPQAQKSTARSQFLEALAADTRQKTLQGLFVWGHGWNADKSTVGGITNSAQTFSVPYSWISQALAYKLGLVVLDVCHGAAGRKWISAPNGLFAGQKGILVPWINSYNVWNVILPGQEGTNQSAHLPFFRRP